MYSVYAMMLGASGVGKTTTCVQIQNRINRENANQNINIYNITPTVGVQFFTFHTTYISTTVKVNIWDTSGEERFDEINKTFYNKIALVYLVYDCSRMKTLDWVKRKHAEMRNKNLSFVLIGNVFVKESTSVQQYALTFATQYNLPIFKVSAINDVNLIYPFIQAAKLIHDLTAAATESPLSPTTNPVLDPIRHRNGIVSIHQSTNSPPDSVVNPIIKSDPNNCEPRHLNDQHCDSQSDCSGVECIQPNNNCKGCKECLSYRCTIV